MSIFYFDTVSVLQHFPVDLFIALQEDVEDDFHVTFCAVFPFFDSFDGDICRFIGRKTENTCRNTAESDTFEAVFKGEIKAARVA